MTSPLPQYEQQLKEAGITRIARLVTSHDKSDRTVLEGSIASVPIRDGMVGSILIYIETTRVVSPAHRSVELIVAILLVEEEKNSGGRASLVAEKTYLPLIQGFPLLARIVQDLITIYVQNRALSAES